MPFDVTVDGQDRLVHLTIDRPRGNAGQVHWLDITYSGFGAPVEVTRPPAGEVDEHPEPGTIPG